MKLVLVILAVLVLVGVAAGLILSDAGTPRDGTGSDKPQRFLRREGLTYPLGSPEDFIGPSNAAHPHARYSRMPEGEKEGPAPQKGGTAPRGCPDARGECGA